MQTELLTHDKILSPDTSDRLPVSHVVYGVRVFGTTVSQKAPHSAEYGAFGVMVMKQGRVFSPVSWR